MELFDRMVALQKEYDRLRQDGMIGACEDGVHVDDDVFDSIPGEAAEQSRGSKEYPWEYSKMYGGVRFYMISRKRNSHLRQKVTR